MAEIQVGEKGGAGQSLIGQVLKGHVVEVKVCELRHGNGFFPKVDHRVVAHVQPCDLTESLQEGESGIRNKNR